jgi:hypothetical protein
VGRCGAGAVRARARQQGVRRMDRLARRDQDRRLRPGLRDARDLHARVPVPRRSQRPVDPARTRRSPDRVLVRPQRLAPLLPDEQETRGHPAVGTHQARRLAPSRRPRLHLPEPGAAPGRGQQALRVIHERAPARGDDEHLLRGVPPRLLVARERPLDLATGPRADRGPREAARRRSLPQTCLHSVSR